LNSLLRCFISQS